ncbi:unnamed protein product, partial [Ixodes pacificus]
MGNELGADTQYRDTITEMTSQEKHVVRDTWAIFKKDAQTSGVAIFVVLFLKHPAYQKLFVAFAADPIAELPQNPRAIAHALTVAYAISSIIDTLDEPETSAELVRKVATNHVRHPTISGAQFEHMGQAVMEVLAEKLGSAMNHQAAGSWQKFFAFVVRVSQSVFKKWPFRKARSEGT